MKTLFKKNRRHERETIRVKRINNCHQNLPRMCIRKTNKHIYVSILDDSNSKTLMAFSSLNEKMMKEGVKGYNVEGAIKIGEESAKVAINKKITNVVVDKGGKKYHGAIQALLEKFFETLDKENK